LNYTPEQFDRLPKWAQMEMKRLIADRAFFAAKLAAGPEDSDTFADPTFDETKRPLGAGTTIEFDLADAGDRQDRLRCRTDATHKGRKYLDVHGGDSLLVVPQAANAVRIFTERL